MWKLVAALLLVVPTGCAWSDGGKDEPVAANGSEARSLTSAEKARAATLVDEARQRVHGTFVGATATPARALVGPAKCTNSRPITVRVIWKDDANFVHGGVLGAQPDGPFKAQLETFCSPAGKVIEQSAQYRAVGPKASETLLSGTRVVDPTGAVE